LSLLIKLEGVRRGTSLGTGERPERHLGAVPAVPYARVGLDVPIETKLHAPNARAEWVERPGLIEFLARSAARLVLVGAPAGFGKTTLVAQWRVSTDENRPFAWVSPDRADDDPSRLWWYAVGALQRACPEFNGEAILRELRVQVPDVTGTVLPLLANELAALPGPVVLVLDDYHVVKERSCHDQIAFLLAHLPPSAQIVLVTRVDPPLPLARMRASGEMVEIRARELRFGPDETAALVRSVSGVRLSEADLADLTERTEGWPAGTYLAALSLRGHPSPHEFVREFTGDNRFIVDFLADEVLGRQPDEIRRFLARTSILSQFCAPLCDAITGSANAVEMIEILERENLFLVPLDDNRQWYRYHQLFAQLLRSQLAITEPGTMRVLHRRASTWHRLSGSTEEAVSHSLAADDIDTAVDLITRYWRAYVDIGRTATVRRWMRQLGDDRIAANPAAAHCAAWAAALVGDRDAVLRWLPVIDSGHYDGTLPDGVQSLRSSAAMLRGVFGFEGLPVMRASAAVAVDMETDPSSPYYALARAALGYSLYLSGESAEAARPLEEAVQSRTSLPIIAMFALSAAALVAVDLGRFSRAEELAQKASALASRSELAKAPQGALAYTAIGAAHAARGRLEEARAELEHAFTPRNVIALSPWPTLEPTLRLAGVRLDLGDKPGAAELADEARVMLTLLPDGTEALRARLAHLERRIAGRPRVVSLAEPLTEREAAVLHLLGGSLSLREIGQELYVSANTVKSHTQAIYRKLGVSTRHDAVEQGKQLRL
jgi:LuxR family transcriptional regulator, maltose regulon positive regulatory protein